MPTPQEIKFSDCGTGILPVLQSLFDVKKKLVIVEQASCLFFKACW
jgi:hypothetical protein